MDNNKVYIFRLNPGEDLRKSIEAFVKEKNITSFEESIADLPKALQSNREIQEKIANLR